MSVLGALLGAACVLFSVGASSAAAAMTCPSSSFCGYTSNNYDGTMYVYGISLYPQNTWFYVGSGPDNRFTSLNNNRVHSTLMSEGWSSGAPTGGIKCIAPGVVSPNLSLGDAGTWPDGSSLSDSISGLALLAYVDC
jgi:hypothetical protein